LKQRQLLHETELRLKRQEYQLKLKKDELKLDTEYAKAVAREEAYAKAESKYLGPIVAPSQPCFRVPLTTACSRNVEDSSKREPLQRLSSARQVEAASLKPSKVDDQASFASSSSSDSNISGLSEQANQILVQQNRVMDEFVKQQQRNTLPRRHIPVFDGNPLEYCTFMRAFETVIKAKEPDSAGRLYYLEQHTSGRPQEIVRSCLYMKAEEGCTQAKKLLESKFGQKHKIAMAYVDQVTNGPRIKDEDTESLEAFSILLSSCTNTLKAIGYSSKNEGPDNMPKTIDGFH